jgi:hypothetical protein
LTSSARLTSNFVDELVDPAVSSNRTYCHLFEPALRAAGPGEWGPDYQRQVGSSAGQTLVKRWSSAGQTLLKNYSACLASTAKYSAWFDFYHRLTTA